MADNKINNTNTVLEWLEKVLEFTKRYSIWEILRTMLLVTIIYIFAQVLFNPEKTYEKYLEYINTRHNEKLELRMANSHQIQDELRMLRLETGAKRAVICELHNGQENVSGFPFMRISATYEATGGEYSITDFYQNLQITNFPIFNLLYEEEIYCGSVLDLKDIDNKLYHKLMANEASYIHIEPIIGKDGTIGFLVLTFDNEPENHKEIHKNIHQSSGKLGILLGGNGNKS